MGDWLLQGKNVCYNYLPEALGGRIYRPFVITTPQVQAHAKRQESHQLSLHEFHAEGREPGLQDLCKNLWSSPVLELERVQARNIARSYNSFTKSHTVQHDGKVAVQHF